MVPTWWLHLEKVLSEQRRAELCLVQRQRSRKNFLRTMTHKLSVDTQEVDPVDKTREGFHRLRQEGTRDNTSHWLWGTEGVLHPVCWAAFLRTTA